MRQILIVLFVSLSCSIYSQTYNSGDKELDAFLTKLNTDAKSDLSQIKTNFATTYNTTMSKIDDLMKKGMAIADVFMSFEIAALTKKNVDDVVKSYETNKEKGWGAIAKEMGIKPGSEEFHALKGNTKKASENSKGKSENSNKGKGKGQGKKN